MNESCFFVFTFEVILKAGAIVDFSDFPVDVFNDKTEVGVFFFCHFIHHFLPGFCRPGSA